MAQTTDAFTAFHDQLMAECRDMVDKRDTKAITDAVQLGITRAVEKVSRPVVQVAAPHVAPTIQMDTPDIQPTITVTVDTDTLAATIAAALDNTETNRLLREILTVLGRPVTKTVHRDGQWISSVTETRG